MNNYINKWIFVNSESFIYTNVFLDNYLATRSSTFYLQQFEYQGTVFSTPVLKSLTIFISKCLVTDQVLMDFGLNDKTGWKISFHVNTAWLAYSLEGSVGIVCGQSCPPST